MGEPCDSAAGPAPAGKSGLPDDDISTVGSLSRLGVSLVIAQSDGEAECQRSGAEQCEASGLRQEELGIEIDRGFAAGKCHRVERQRRGDCHQRLA